MKQLLRRALALAAIAGAHGVALTIACTIPGGESCETIETPCPSGTTNTEIVWQNLCCGTQELPGYCCQFYCEKLLCLPSETEVCSRLFISSTASYSCYPPNQYGAMLCAAQMGGGG